MERIDEITALLHEYYSAGKRPSRYDKFAAEQLETELEALLAESNTND